MGTKKWIKIFTFCPKWQKPVKKIWKSAKKFFHPKLTIRARKWKRKWKAPQGRKLRSTRPRRGREISVLVTTEKCKFFTKKWELQTIGEKFYPFNPLNPISPPPWRGGGGQGGGEIGFRGLTECRKVKNVTRNLQVSILKIFWEKFRTFKWLWYFFSSTAGILL